MTINDRWGQVCALTAALLLLGAGAALAQLQSGNLYGKVSDEHGNALAGVTVTLDTGEAPQTQFTNAKGEFHFLGLAPGNYGIKAELAHFSPVADAHIIISVGRNANLELTMNSNFEDIVNITEEPPLLDPRQIRTGADVNLTELQRIPTGRDPWTVLQGTPGVLVDRVNVGGNQSGQQSAYTGPGSFGFQSVWSVDGVVITDMSATGSTPAYYDFDSFEEMQISTGGSDSTIASGGVVLNIVTKRGTNEYRGSARYLQVPGGTQSNTTFKSTDVPAAQQSTFAGGSNKINKVEDFGGEIGGPILKDHLWLWGSYGEQKVSVQTLPKIVPGNPAQSTPNGLTDNTKLPAWNAKLNAQLTASNYLTFVGMNSSKEKQGRNAGPTRPTETTWNQGQFGGKPTLLKAEDTQIFSPNLYLTVLYSHVYGGFFLLPQSGTGPDVPPAFRDNTTTWHNSFVGQTIKRPQTQEKADASTFFNTGSVSHELKYGASYRVATAITSVAWQGGGFVLENGLVGLPPGTNYLNLTRTGIPGTKTKYASGYAQDTLTAGNLTANVGLRYDHQGGDNIADSVPANPVRPDLLPAVSYGGGPIGFTWKTWSPRLGLTYALGKDQSTLLRASYSRFADQLGTVPANWLNPFAANSYYYAYTTYPGTGHLTPGQIQQVGNGYSSNVDPHDPHKFMFNTIAKGGINAPVTDELLLSGEHALLPEFVVGVNLTYRRYSNLLQQDLLVFDPGTTIGNGNYGRVATRNDFTPVTVIATLPNGSTEPVTWYKLVPGLRTVHGYNLKNGDYETTFKGAALTFNKRLANRWMLRGNISYNDWYWSKAGDRPDPTPLLAGGTTDGTYVRQGDAVLQGSGPASGNFQNVYINSKWSFAVNGLYQIAPERPWGFNVAGNLTGRQGYPDPYYISLGGAAVSHLSVPNPNTGGETVQIGAADSNRLDNIVDFDARIEKELTFQNFGLTLGVDCFNVFNEAFVLQRQGKFQNSAAPVTLNAGFVNEVLSPRVFRFGARFSFK
jgi:hypothetical protein